LDRVQLTAQEKGYVGRTIGIKLRFADFRTVTRDVTLRTPTADAGAIRHAAGDCLRRVALDQRLRLVGVRASSLSSAAATQPDDPPRQAELPLALQECRAEPGPPADPG
jgi:DNA polymerase-4